MERGRRGRGTDRWSEALPAVGAVRRTLEGAGEQAAKVEPVLVLALLIRLEGSEEVEERVLHLFRDLDLLHVLRGLFKFVEPVPQKKGPE